MQTGHSGILTFQGYIRGLDLVWECICFWTRSSARYELSNNIFVWWERLKRVSGTNSVDEITIVRAVFVCFFLVSLTRDAMHSIDHPWHPDQPLLNLFRSLF
jgi:hypothetical protein